MAAKISNWRGTRSHSSHLSGALVIEVARLLGRIKLARLLGTYRGGQAIWDV